MSKKILTRCSIDGCGSNSVCRELCHKHYSRLLRHGDPLRERPTIEQRFWLKVDKSKGCWEWTAALSADGYGKFIAQRTSTAHRFSWELHNGTIPDGMYVLHKCDNRKCCNIDHLFLGTAKDNMDDMRSKGRQYNPSGENSGGARLRNDDILSIRRLFSQGVGRVLLAERYGSCISHISSIVARRCWKHI